MIPEKIEQCFSSNEACQRYLYPLRWPKGFVCPKCGGEKNRIFQGLYLCLDCNRKTSITQGTIFQDTHLPLTTWFQIMWHVCISDGISALKLQRDLKLGSYRTAWLCLHKLRKVMAPDCQCKLRGEVEFDVIVINIKKKDRQDKKVSSEIAIVAILNEKLRGQVRLIHVPSLSSKDLERSISHWVDSCEAIIVKGVPKFCAFFPQYEKNIIYGEKRNCAKLPLCKDVKEKLYKRFYKIKEPIGQEYLQDYLNEFSFRYNYRKSRRSLLFCHLAERAMLSKEVTYSEIIRHR